MSEHESSVSQIISDVCQKWGITEENLKGNSRINIFVMARREAAKAMRESTDISYTSIGVILGGRDHATVLRYFKK